MKGIVLAGGNGSRLWPLTKVTNKHLLPVGKKPMIYHSIEKMIEIGIREIMIITGTDHMGSIVSLLGSGKEFNCDFTYKVQDQPDGIAGALKLAKNFSKNQDICVILGDNIFEDTLHDSKNKFESMGGNVNCLLNIKKVENPSRFGVPTIKGDKITRIIEKPLVPETSYCVTGIYFYDSKVFDYIEKLKKSKRGEFEITDVNNFYIKEGSVSFVELAGWWSDAGTHLSYHNANSHLREKE